ncbi:MAG TPA: pyrroline-5-carboxylate reductase [Solirubrobacteraceae bacterium]|nr:pyrroline-5-carboxylate reductase [Solirubrobacteraceae bacterium]
MRIGLIGAGSMARAMARGWGEPVVATDGGSGRARALVGELGGEAVADAAQVAARADVVVLAFKPYQLGAVAPGLAGFPGEALSVLGGVDAEALRAALPGVRVVRALPNTPVELRRGVTVLAEETPPSDELRALLERLGLVVDVPDRLVDVATGTMGTTPAYFALIAEAMIDAAVKRGLGAELAARLVAQTMEGTGALIAHAGHDPVAVRRGVTSPGGSTARGLAALERRGVRAAFIDALEEVLGP